MYEALLKSLSLSENEAQIYEALLNLGHSPARDILKKAPQLKRSNLYNILNALKNKGLIGEKIDSKTGLTVFYPETPDRLEDLLVEQNRELTQTENQLESNLPALKNLFLFTQEKPIVRFYEGDEGIKKVLYDSLTTKGEIYTFADTEAVEKYIKKINQEYVKKRLELKIPKKIIVVDSPFAREHFKQTSGPYIEVRFIPPESKPFQTALQVYNNKISYTTLTDKKKIGVIIEDENIAQIHKSLFEYIWSTTKPPV